jgi:hydrogenase expression/formation protein HypE
LSWRSSKRRDKSLRADGDAIFVREETRAVCEAVGIDPLEAIGSGALLAAAEPKKARKILAALEKEGIRAAVVGKFLERGAPRRITRGGRTKPLVPPAVDAIARLYG